MDLSAGAAIREDALYAAAARVLLPVLLLLLRRRLPSLAFLRLPTFRTGMTVILLLLLRLQQVRDSRHTAVCLGTSSYSYSWYYLVIVLHVVMTYDRSIGAREAGSGNDVLFYLWTRRRDPRGACTA